MMLNHIHHTVESFTGIGHIKNKPGMKHNLLEIILHLVGIAFVSTIQIIGIEKHFVSIVFT